MKKYNIETIFSNENTLVEQLSSEELALLKGGEASCKDGGGCSSGGGCAKGGKKCSQETFTDAWQV